MFQAQKGFLHRLMQVWCFLLPFQSSLLLAVHGQSACILSIDELESAESQVTDFSVERLYTLCPQTTYTIGRQDYFGTLLVETGSKMIHLRPNLHIQCGDTAARSNGCVVSGGTVQVDGTSFFGANATVLSNVRMTGITFTNVEKYHVWIDQPGDVVFTDCSFQVCYIENTFGAVKYAAKWSYAILIFLSDRILRMPYYRFYWIILIQRVLPRYLMLQSNNVNF